MILLGLVVGGLGTALLVISALGLFRLPDALSRQHAATKSGTLALGLILLGVALQAGALHSGAWGWWLRIGLIAGFLYATLPVASHLLARAAARESCAAEVFEHATRVPREAASDPKPVKGGEGA